MNVSKIGWGFRAIIYKIRFKKIGNFSYIGKPILLMNTKNMILGNKVRIFPNARLECHQNGRIIIEDNVSIGQNFHCTSMLDNLIIGKGTVISGNVFITNIDHEYQDIEKPVLEQALIYSETEIGEDCFIGFGAGIQAGTKLGKHCIVGANSIIKGEFPDYSVIVGTPGRIVKRYSYEEDDWI